MANPVGIKAIIDQQFEVGKQIIKEGLVPILKAEILAGLNKLAPDQHVMLKLSLPSKDNQYAELIAHPNCDRVVALSGGYSLEESCDKLAKNDKMIASFSR